MDSLDAEGRSIEAGKDSESIRADARETTSEPSLVLLGFFKPLGQIRLRLQPEPLTFSQEPDFAEVVLAFIHALQILRKRNPA